jgi:hypothetical protein
MSSNENGFSTAFAMTVIFSLCVIILSFVMLVAANEKKINAYRKLIDSRKETDSIVFSIEETLQVLKEYPNDIDEQYIASLISSVCDYDFTVEDVSTGINKNFASENFLENEAILQYIFSNEDSAFVEYGWINQKIVDQASLEGCIKDFENKNIFPLLNNLPPLNIYFMNDDFIKSVLEYSNIKNGDKKLERIRENLNAETTSKELAGILEVSENHSLFDLVGFKTIFWQISFDTDKCRCIAVFAAVPKKESQKEIDKYILVKKNTSYKGGSL